MSWLLKILEMFGQAIKTAQVTLVSNGQANIFNLAIEWIDQFVTTGANLYVRGIHLSLYQSRLFAVENASYNVSI